MNIRYRQSNKGFSLIEVLICVVLVAAVASAALSLHYESLKLSMYSGQKTQAYFLAKQGIDVVNYLNDMGNFTFNPNTKYYLNSPGAGNVWELNNLRTSFDINGDRFFRYVEFTNKLPSDLNGRKDKDNVDLSEKYYKVKVRVCYAEMAVSESKCKDATRNVLDDITYMVKK